MPSPDPIRHFTEFAIGAFFQSPEGASGAEQEFFSSTNRIIASLYDQGLESDEAFRLWRELQQEGWHVTDSIASSIGAMRRDAVIQLLDALPLPKAIWNGLAHEYNESRLHHVRDHPYRWAEGEEGRAEFILRHGPTDRLITDFRSLQDVARVASFVFCSQHTESSPGFRAKYGSHISGGVDIIPGISVAPAFRRLDGHLGGLEFAGDSPISKLYNPNYSFINRVEISPRQLNNRNAQLASEAYQALRREGGEIPEDRAQVLAEQGGRFKVFLEPQRWKSTELGWEVCVDAFGFRVPFGALPITRTELECYQAKIELGQCRACAFNIRGRIDPDLISWLGHGVDGSHDPIPDVELVYMVPLPSGREFPLLLKAARNYSLRQHQDIEKLPDEDRRVVESIGVHFLDPYNKRSMRVLTEFRVEDYPSHLVSNLSKVSAISDLDDYRALRRAWDHSVQLQLLESQATLSHVVAHQEFSNPRLSNLDQFIEHCAHRIDEIPDQQSYHPAEYFRVSQAQKHQLLLEVVPKLFNIQQGEKLRVRIEASTDLPARRSAQGYDGPAEGYPLPLDHMLMDAITDLRKKERYRESVAAKKGVDPSTVEIPTHVGRHYDRPERFFSVAELPARLAEFADEKGFRRSTSIRLYDPESDRKYVEYPFAQREKLQRLIWETNFERMRPAVSNLERRIKVEEERYEISSIGRISSAILVRLFDDSYAQVEKFMRREKELEAVRRKEIPLLYAHLTSQGSDPEMRSRLVESAQERNHLDVVHNEARLQGAFIRLQYLFETFLSADLMRCGLRGNSIIDQQSVKLIYAIGSSGQPILELEAARKGRDARSTHSELLGGRCMYAGGELILSKHDQVFHSVPAWTEFDANLRRAAPSERPWYLQELNNSTGHYRVWSNTLPFAASIIFPQMEGAGISTTRCEIVDRLAKGLHVRGTGVYRF